MSVSVCPSGRAVLATTPLWPAHPESQGLTERLSGNYVLCYVAQTSAFIQEATMARRVIPTIERFFGRGDVRARLRELESIKDRTLYEQGFFRR